MFWRFGFSSTSSLETLLDNPNVSLEEILDEDELLQECKSQNPKLFTYLKQPRVLKRLFEHVVGLAEVGGPGGKEWEEKVRFKYPYICSEVLATDSWAISEIAIANSEDLLGPFWDAILTRDASDSEPSIPHHMHPFFASASNEPHSPRYNNSNLPKVPGEDNEEQNSPQLGVLGLEIKNEEDKRVTSARDNGPGKSVLAGYWAKVNGVFLDKNGKGMLSFLKSQPQIMERFVAHLETPAVVDVLYRIIQCEEHVPDANVIDWLASQELIPRIVDLLSPHHSSDLHNTVSELLKAIIALSAPSPANLTQNQGASEAFGIGGSNSFGALSSRSGVNNRLVRELANDTSVRKMVGFMLDFSIPSQLARKLSLDASSSEPKESSREKEDIEDVNGRITPGRRPLDPCDTPAASSTTSLHLISTDSDRIEEEKSPIKAPQIDVTPESCTSSLVTCIGVLIELIRKNNSDYFEQHLFHTLRTHLLQRQQEIADKRAKEKAERKEEQETNAEEDDEMEGMEEAMAEMSNELGIVHLGPMLRILCERLPDFQHLLMRSKEHAETVSTSLGTVAALTFERYRITELYAELLHCSNMALLNRVAGEGPQYNEDGILQGGIEGLQILARTLQGGDGSSESAEGGPNDSTTADITLNENLAMTPIDSAAPNNADVETSTATEMDTTESKDSDRPVEVEIAHTRDTTKHTREGANRINGSDEVEDEALLSEISLSAALPAVSNTASETSIETTADDLDADATESKEESSSREASKAESNLSTSSHAEVTLTAASSPTSPIPLDEESEGKSHVVGDLLKMQFLRSNVIDTILSLFFAYPWNNFLHNVVYDILQQFFNGRMDTGLNRKLTLAVFEKARLTEKIVEGHRRNEESLLGPRKIRMGYMGHMNLIAEETVKLLERYPEEVEKQVKDLITPAWQEYVNETLRENREKEAAPLAGGRPTGGFSMQSGEETISADGNLPANMQVFVNYLKSQMGDASTSDDDEDEEEERHQQQNSDADAGWMSRNSQSKQIYFNDGEGEGSGEDGFEDAFQPISSTFSQGRRGLTEDEDDDEDDDEWGPFADSSDIGTSSNHTAISSAQAYLTPADWASDFQRSTAAAEQDQFQHHFGQGEEVTKSPKANGTEEGEAMTRRDSTDSSDSSNSTPFIDLLDSASYRQTDVVAAAHARRPSLGQLESPHSTSIGMEAGRRASSGSGSSDPSAANAIHDDEPLGPGVSPDAHSNVETGMIERVIDGKKIQVPLDDVALVSQHGNESEKDNESAVADD